MNSEKSESPEMAIVPTSLPTVRPEDFLPPISRWTTLGGLSLLATFFPCLPGQGFLDTMSLSRLQP